mmetsp:Transcript_18767/g.23025  ORF Transcript_18767/g.23025 Transcript_18767/m.23025 type:complete len:204 (-) Transcript_18767:141-752(-)
MSNNQIIYDNNMSTSKDNRLFWATDQDLTEFVDCFDVDETMKHLFDNEEGSCLVPLQDISMISSRRDSFIGSFKTDHYNMRRLSMLQSVNESLQMDSIHSTSNEYQECFEQFRTNSIAREQSCQSSYPNMDTLPGEFEHRFQQSLSKLEQSMRRSERSRKMLGEQKKYSDVSSLTSSSVTNHIAQSQSQLRTYMSHMGGNVSM